MEQLTAGGAIAEGEWSSLSGTFTAEEAAFMAQLLTPSDPFNMPALHHDQLSNNGGSYSSQFLFPTQNNYYPSSNFRLGDQVENSSNHGGFHFEDEQEDSMNTNVEMSESNNCFLQPYFEGDELIKLPEEEEGHHLLENCKKRSRGCGEAEKRRNIERSKKTQKLSSTTINIEEDGNAGHSRPSTSNYCSEDESYASLEINGGANNSVSTSKGPAKSRASRGSATDPQSLYARRRRERINERLRILQNLVPNGTKVDISTMLEEAVQYVKFLQLQIKLLSSDDLWMYAPIAYNGMDIGLNPTPNTPKEL